MFVKPHGNPTRMLPLIDYFSPAPVVLTFCFFPGVPSIVGMQAFSAGTVAA